MPAPAVIHCKSPALPMIQHPQPHNALQDSVSVQCSITNIETFNDTHHITSHHTTPHQTTPPSPHLVRIYHHIPCYRSGQSTQWWWRWWSQTPDGDVEGTLGSSHHGTCYLTSYREVHRRKCSVIEFRYMQRQHIKQQFTIIYITVGKLTLPIGRIRIEISTIALSGGMHVLIPSRIGIFVIYTEEERVERFKRKS